MMRNVIKKLSFFFLSLMIILNSVYTLSIQSISASEIKTGTIPNLLSWELAEDNDMLRITFVDGYTETFKNNICFVDGTVISTLSEWNLDNLNSEEHKVMLEWILEKPLKEIFFSDNVIEIEEQFNANYWNNVQKITLGKNVERIGDNVFAFSEAKEIVFSDKLLEIGKESFGGCKYLQSITLPESLEVLEEGAFYDCNILTDVTVLSRDAIFETYCLGYEFNGEPLDNMIIRGYKDSTAETYANENNFEFVPLNEETTTTTSTISTSTEMTTTTVMENTTTETSSETTSQNTTTTTNSTTTSVSTTSKKSSAKEDSPKTGDKGIIGIGAVLLSAFGMFCVSKKRQ